jgi:type IV pilus assembly protein PilE
MFVWVFIICRIERQRRCKLALSDAASQCVNVWPQGAQTSDMNSSRLTSVTGFTLIEMLFSVMLMGLIMGIALPSFEQQWLKSRRQALQNNLLQLHLRQLQWRGLHALYADKISDLGNIHVNSTLYSLSLDNVSTQTYTLHAQAIGHQTRDVNCRVMSLRMSSNGQLMRTSNASEIDDPQKCWS